MTDEPTASDLQAAIQGLVPELHVDGDRVWFTTRTEPESEI